MNKIIKNNINVLQEKVINKIEQWKKEIISLIDENLIEKNEELKQNKKGEKDKIQKWADIITEHFSDNNRDYIKRKFKIIEQTSSGTIIQCTLWECDFKLNSRGEGWHWKKHTRLLEKMNFSIESDKIKVICKWCTPNKRMNIFDALDHFRTQHYQNLQKTKLVENKDKALQL